MSDLPPKGTVSLVDLQKMYNLLHKPISNSQLEDVVYRIWEDLVFSLQAIKDWYDNSNKIDLIDNCGSIENHLDDLYAAKNVDIMILAIDNCLNNYHGVSMFLEYIINADFDEANKFLDKIKNK